MRHEGEVRVAWTRAELLAIREALEVTPNFEGRLDAREVVRLALRAPRLRDVTWERGLAERVANRIVPIDQPTALARAKLLLAVRGPRKRQGFQPVKPHLVAVPGSSAVSAAA